MKPGSTLEADAAMATPEQVAASATADRASPDGVGRPPSGAPSLSRGAC